MYTVRVRDHFMIAHSFKGDVFGPAQKLHGATYVVDVEFRSPALDANGIVIDIGLATDAVHKIPAS
jgi:6-pyruvoyl-tetrahydropterin synthase